ncbi:MAG: HAD family hydrolase [Candidatus Korobacteraceae bacterium]
MRYQQLLVTDADNTLWETDEVYAAAQLQLLKSVEERYGVSARTEDRLGFVREIDQALASRHAKHLGYPAEHLVDAILFAVRAGNVDHAVTEALRASATTSKAESIANAFFQHVSNEIPRLRNGVAQAVPRLVRHQVRIVVLTEGDLARCERLLKRHGLSRHVAAVISEKKTVESYVDLRRRFGSLNEPVMIGDQIDRDIELSKLAGYVTVYFPGGFKPAWTRDRQIAADYVITNFEQVAPIMGVSESNPV